MNTVLSSNLNSKPPGNLEPPPGAPLPAPGRSQAAVTVIQWNCDSVFTLIKPCVLLILKFK